MLIYGIMMVRNEVDILRINVLHHLMSGIDRFLIMDNGSSDGTDRVLQGLGRDARVQWTRHAGDFRQADLTTELAREAFRRGADWVIPIDADEFWVAPGGDFRHILATSLAGALKVQVVNFVQRREQSTATRDALLTMTRRPPRPIGPAAQISTIVETHQIGFVEILYPPKWISRATARLDIAQGNHSVTGIEGEYQDTDQIVCLHAPLRARTILESKVDQGRRVEELSTYLEQAWHVRRWRRIAVEGGLDQEWEANSYANDHLDVYGVRRPLVFDTRLRDVVKPWVALANQPGHVSLSVGSLAVEPRTPTYADGASSLLTQDGAPATLGEVPEPGFVLPALIKAPLATIEGWLRGEEADVLIELAERVLREPGLAAIVEVGSYCGKSTVVLGNVVKTLCPLAHIYAIDPHEGQVGSLEMGIQQTSPTLEALQRNLADTALTDTVTIIPQRSYEVDWDKPISLLFIDGIHDYLNVSRDFYHFEPYVTPGGYVAFHDCEPTFPGVVDFVNDVLSTGHYREVERAQSLVVVQKLRPTERRVTVTTAVTMSAPRAAVGEDEFDTAFAADSVASSHIELADTDGISELPTDADVTHHHIRVLTEDNKTLQRRTCTLGEKCEGIQREAGALHHAIADERARGVELREMLLRAQDQLAQQERELQALHSQPPLQSQPVSAYDPALDWIVTSKAWRAVMFYYGLRARLKAIIGR